MPSQLLLSNLECIIGLHATLNGVTAAVAAYPQHAGRIKWLKILSAGQAMENPQQHPLLNGLLTQLRQLTISNLRPVAGQVFNGLSLHEIGEATLPNLSTLIVEVRTL